MVPHVRDRPLALQSVPQGRRRRGLLPEERAAALPRLDRRRSTCPSARAARCATSLANDAATLVYLAGPERRSRRTSGRAGPTASSARTASSSTSIRRAQDFAEVRAAARAPGRPAARPRPGAVRDDHGLARAARGRAAAAHAPTTRRCTRSPGPSPTARGRAPGPAHGRVPSREARRADLRRHEPQRATASTPSRPTPCGPAAAPRWPRRCAGRSSTTRRSTRRAGPSRRSARAWPSVGDPWA